MSVIKAMVLLAERETMAENTIVVQAGLKTGLRTRIGYFSDLDSVPEGWEVRDDQYDISDIMEANSWTCEQALEAMNR